MKSLNRGVSIHGWSLLLAFLLGCGFFIAACADDERTTLFTTPPPTPPTSPPLPPDSQHLTAPIGLRVSASGTDFIEWRWTPVADVNGYEIQFTGDEVFTDEDEIIARTVEQPFYRREGLAPVTSAYVRVRSAAGSGDSRRTSAWSGHVKGVTDAPTPESPLVFVVNFDATPLGDYTQDAFDSDWPDHEWVHGLDTGRAEIVDGPSAYSGRSLRLKYPAGTYGSGNHAIQAKIKLPRMYETLYVSYRVRFQESFDFVKGGKLPGLIGGAGNTGGNRPNGNDGWSGRMMWRRGGGVVQYVYHPDQPGIYGEDFSWERFFQPGRWHTVEHMFTMNTPRVNDGVLHTWFDGMSTLVVDTLRFRDVDTFAIEHFYISTFFGGGDSTWAATKDEFIYFDDFVISTERIQQ